MLMLIQNLEQNDMYETLILLEFLCNLSNLLAVCPGGQWLFLLLFGKCLQFICKQ